ncbi:la-related protein 7-like isoform X1 [Oncorhynchus masou masou]|uniref:la-related protein 7-like isoform X1 n=1 Tax=Oncorhynchus masou masou TaxID=90313 RepID=UPI003183732A
MDGKEEDNKSRERAKQDASSQMETTVGGGKQEIESESQPSDRKRKHTAELAEGVALAEGTGKLPSRKLEKKRRRSQTGESSESDTQGDMPSKLRKTSEDDKVESDGKDLQVKGEEEEDKMEDYLLKAKRTRKKKHKERVKIREEVIPLRVLSKKVWLKQEYMTLQKRSMGALKTCLTKFHHKGAGGKMETSLQQTSEESKAGEKETSLGAASSRSHSPNPFLAEKSSRRP